MNSLEIILLILLIVYAVSIVFVIGLFLWLCYSKPRLPKERRKAWLKKLWLDILLSPIIMFYFISDKIKCTRRKLNKADDEQSNILSVEEESNILPIEEELKKRNQK